MIKKNSYLRRFNVGYNVILLTSQYNLIGYSFNQTTVAQAILNSDRTIDGKVYIMYRFRVLRSQEFAMFKYRV